MAKKLTVEERKQLARNAAARMYGCDETEIDNKNSKVSLTEKGAFVQAWVWVSNIDMGLEEAN